jgi:hypothetical protein
MEKQVRLVIFPFFIVVAAFIASFIMTVHYIGAKETANAISWGSAAFIWLAVTALYCYFAIARKEKEDADDKEI